MPEYTSEELELLIDGKLSWDRVQEIIKNPKDEDRTEKIAAVYQRRAAFSERILLPLTPHLFIVEGRDNYPVKCLCGQEFGDFRANWKLYSSIYVRDTAESMEEVYPGLQRPDPELCEVREYYCPNCASLLEVETLPPGMPAEFEFLPDLDTFYRDWLHKPLANKVEFVDKTADVIRQWVEKAG